MPITSSAKKALKRSEKLQERNLKFKSSMKSEIKKIKKEVEKVSKWEVKKDSLKNMLDTVYSAIDKAKKRNILHKNAAARKKSKLTKMVNKILA